MARPAAPAPDPEAAVAEMVRRIVERFDPDKIVLFGSRARGDAGPESDVDLLVVMPVEGSRRAKAAEIRLTLCGLGVPIDVIVVEPGDVERARATLGGVTRAALREGKVLHERAA